MQTAVGFWPAAASRVAINCTLLYSTGNTVALLRIDLDGSVHGLGIITQGWDL